MTLLGTPRAAVLAGGAIVAGAAMSGVLLARSDERASLLLAGLLFAMVAAVVAEFPIAGFFGLTAVLGLVPELTRDDRLVGATTVAFGALVSGVAAVDVLLVLVAVVFALGIDTSRRWWPGAPATVALALLVVALANVVWFSRFLPGLFIARPVVFLVLSILVGYWACLRYGTDLPLLALVVAGMLAIPGGLYNAVAGDLSYYDASFVYLIGMAAIVVFFRLVDVGMLRLPFLAFAVLVIGLSTRRGAIVTVVVAFLVATMFVSRGNLRRLLLVAVTVIVVTELAEPDFALSRLQTLFGFFSGSSGHRAVHERDWEAANAWVNIDKHWVAGIGPTASWRLYDTSGGLFIPDVDMRHYLHNSFQWVWLRYGFIGLLVFIAFLATSALSLVRRSAPVISLIVGGSMVGLTAGLVTGSWLTTTTRWPLMVGLYLGIALAAMHAENSDRATTPVSVPMRETYRARLLA